MRYTCLSAERVVMGVGEGGGAWVSVELGLAAAIPKVAAKEAPT